MSNDYGLTAENLLSVLPPVLANDESMNALATAVADNLASQNAEIDNIKIFSAIDSLPETLCDILAVDLKVDWYSYEYPLKIKRNLIKTAFIIHRTLGTVGAVKTALDAIYPGSIVEEWFNYEGDPYYFRVILDVTEQIIDNILEPSLRKAINTYKPLRARLENDAIIFRSRHNFEMRTATGYVQYNTRLCCTFPYVRTYGEIIDGVLEFVTSTYGTSYETPRSDTIEVGTYPKLATQGAITEPDIQLKTSKYGQSYGVPEAGAIENGTYPSIATQGNVASTNARANTSAESVTYGVPLTSADSGGYDYNVPFCGSDTL